jgi:hypothetical protein
VRILLPLVVALAGVLTARADPPLRTDDAYIVDPGRCQVEGQVWRGRRGEREQAVEFGCGFSEWLELAVARGSSRTTALQAKVLPLPMDKSPYGYGFAFGVLRSEPRGGEASSDPFVNLIGGLKLLDERVAVYANLGAVRDRRENLTRATAGLAGEYTVNPNVQLVAEVTGIRGQKPAPLAGVRLFSVPEHLHVTVAAGRRSTTVGFHWDF